MKDYKNCTSKNYKETNRVFWLWWVLFIMLVAASGDTWSKNTIVVIGQSNAALLVVKGGLTTKADVNVINCAVGGIQIDLLMPNYDARSLYGQCMAKINNSIKNGDVITGIVFAQGERDACNGKEPDGKTPLSVNWPVKFTKLISQFRSDIGKGNIPLVVLVMNSLPHTVSKFPYWRSLRYFQMSMNTPNTYKLDSDSYPFRVDDAYPQDSIHLTDEGYGLFAIDVLKLLVL